MIKTILYINKKINFLRSVSIFVLLLNIGCSCTKKSLPQIAESHIIYLIDYTIYNERKKELKKKLDSVLAELSKNFQEVVIGSAYNKYNTKISVGIIDEKGGNRLKECFSFKGVDTRKKAREKLKKEIEKLKGCFNNHWNKIKNTDSKKYKKTLYIQSISNTLNDLNKHNLKDFKYHEINILGDMAIVDRFCFLEENSTENKECKCDEKGISNLKSLNKEIKELKEKTNLSIILDWFNIPGEEKCYFERRRILKKYIEISSSHSSKY